MERKLQTYSNDEFDFFSQNFPDRANDVRQVIADARVNNITLEEIQRRVIANMQTDIATISSQPDEEDKRAQLTRLYLIYFNKLIAIDLCRWLGYGDPTKVVSKPTISLRDSLIADSEQKKLFTDVLIAAGQYASVLWDSWKE